MRSPVSTDAAADVQLHREALPNGRAYVIAEVSDGEFHDDIPEILVEPGRYFVLGDNRDRAYDSRFPDFGTIPLAVIADRASIIWMSGD